MFTIIQLTDTHLLEDPCKVSKEKVPYQQLLLALEHAEKSVPGEKLFMVTGDLVSDTTPSTYKLLSGIFNQIKSPVHIIPGNHDDGEMIKQNITGANIHHGGEFSFNNWLIITLDTSKPGKLLGSGRLSVAELDRLEHLLSNNKTKDVLIFMHHPPIKFGAKWFQDICLENMEEFQAVIHGRDNIRAVAFGHAHTQYTALINNCLYICSPSTWRQMNHIVHDRAEYSDALGGYNWYQLGESDSLFQFGTNYFHHERLV